MLNCLILLNVFASIKWVKVTIQIKTWRSTCSAELTVTDIHYGNDIVRYGRSQIARMGRRAYEGVRGIRLTIRWNVFPIKTSMHSGKWHGNRQRCLCVHWYRQGVVRRRQPQGWLRRNNTLNYHFTMNGEKQRENKGFFLGTIAMNDLSIRQ